jgi:hypothetical protein
MKWTMRKDVSASGHAAGGWRWTRKENDAHQTAGRAFASLQECRLDAIRHGMPETFDADLVFTRITGH